MNNDIKMFLPRLSTEELQAELASRFPQGFVCLAHGSEDWVRSAYGSPLVRLGLIEAYRTILKEALLRQELSEDGLENSRTR